MDSPLHIFAVVFTVTVIVVGAFGVDRGMKLWIGRRTKRINDLEERHTAALWAYHRAPNDEALERFARETGYALFEARNRDLPTAHDLAILEENLALARDFPPPGRTPSPRDR